MSSVVLLFIWEIFPVSLWNFFVSSEKWWCPAIVPPKPEIPKSRSKKVEAPKTPEVGHYCLIRYCPNESNGEFVNIGVMLFLPQRCWVVIRVTPTTKREEQAFPNSTNFIILQGCKNDLAEHAKSYCYKFRTIGEAGKFLTRYYNGFCFSPTWDIVCVNSVGHTLDELYNKYFANEP